MAVAKVATKVAEEAMTVKVVVTTASNVVVVAAGELIKQPYVLRRLTALFCFLVRWSLFQTDVSLLLRHKDHAHDRDIAPYEIYCGNLPNDCVEGDFQSHIFKDCKVSGDGGLLALLHALDSRLPTD